MNTINSGEIILRCQVTNIKNIVFDLGNVLISYQPESFHCSRGDSPDIVRLYLREIYESREWQMIDKGVMSAGEAARSISARTILTEEEINSVFDLREALLRQIADNTKLLPILKKAGKNLYYVSNFPADMFEILTSKYDFFSLFDGGVVSSFEKVLKPDLLIYRILIDRYHIRPGESLFIDDLPANIAGAGKAGFSTLHLVKPEHLEPSLRLLFPPVFNNQ